MSNLLFCFYACLFICCLLHLIPVLICKLELAYKNIQLLNKTDHTKYQTSVIDANN